MIKFFYSLLLVLLINVAFAQNGVGIFEGQTDVGQPKIKGSSSYDDATQTYTLKGGGYNIWFNKDEFHFLYKKISGDFILTANFELIGNEDGNGHRKTGWMIRENTDHDAVSVNSCVHGDGLAVLQWRPIKGAFMRDPKDEIFFPKKYYSIIQLERIGKKITMRLAHDGEPLQETGTTELPDMKDEVLVGLYVLAHDPDDLQEARIWNVRIDKPIANDFHPNPLVKLPITQTKTLGSRLETLEISTGKRSIIYESAKTRFGSPTWMPDGRAILFNQQNSLYTISFTGGTPEKLSVGSLDKIGYGQHFSTNKKLVVFNATTESEGSIFTMPLTGGNPLPIAERLASRNSIWYSKGNNLVVVKTEKYADNIYRITNGKEKPLSKNIRGRVGGVEGSPDGKYIYYNDNTTGTMQLWRMNADGTAKERLTYDEYHNWFPHVSPDGKWIAFLSFPADIDPDGLPSYKNVMLRLMPTSGGAPRVIAYLYGGQGTLNSPNWSPDSKKLVFVSNSQEVGQ